MTPRFFADEIGGGLGRVRAALDTAIRTGRLRDGTPLTAAGREAEEEDIRNTARFASEIGAVPRVLPNLAFADTLVLWSGQREIRLFSEPGDAPGSTVLYLPSERLLVAGDVLVTPEDGQGPPPWITHSYTITPWLSALRSFESLDVSVIVPGQGPALHDKAYLARTLEVCESLLGQVHAALGRGAVTLDEVELMVKGDSVAGEYALESSTPPARWQRFVHTFVRKAFQESLDVIR
jgi:glyoxylase-like metal-dependent hydrolase (beta-lactamase superfamily II)